MINKKQNNKNQYSDKKCKHKWVRERGTYPIAFRCNKCSKPAPSHITDKLAKEFVQWWESNSPEIKRIKDIKKFINKSKNE